MGKPLQGIIGLAVLAIIGCYIMLREPPAKIESGDLMPKTLEVIGNVWIVIPVAIALFLIIPCLANSSYMTAETVPTWRPKKKKQLPHEEYEEEQRNNATAADLGIVDTHEEQSRIESETTHVRT
jgi:hypothetical protein